jgi:hypothetical protein
LPSGRAAQAKERVDSVRPSNPRLISAPDFCGFLVSCQPSVGSELGDPIDREVCQARQDRAKIVADRDLESACLDHRLKKSPLFHFRVPRMHRRCLKTKGSISRVSGDNYRNRVCRPRFAEMKESIASGSPRLKASTFVAPGLRVAASFNSPRRFNALMNWHWISLTTPILCFESFP